MEEAYKCGKLKAIGVSNFYPDRLVDLCKFVEIKEALINCEKRINQCLLKLNVLTQCSTFLLLP